jgi:four helix bundle protein
MTEISNILWEVREGSAVYDLEKRTYQFALAVRKFTKTLPQTISNREDVKQLIRASGSVGANYIEANEALSKKDFLMRIRISRKEAKESIYWLRLLRDNNNLEYDNEVNRLIREATELKKIFSTIIEKSK